MNAHLAIPAKDIKESKAFYEMLGATVGREYEDSVILKFFDIQLVLHKSDKFDPVPQMYPRHFGVVFSSVEKFLLTHAEIVSNTLFKDEYIYKNFFSRHVGKPEEHRTFFLKDPSNNLIEFKWYVNEAAVFGL